MEGTVLGNLLLAALSAETLPKVLSSKIGGLKRWDEGRWD